MNGPDLQYRIKDVKEEDGEIWARLEILQPTEETDLALESALQELDRRCSPFGMKRSEALNWMLGHPHLDEFFNQILEHKRKPKQ